MCYRTIGSASRDKTLAAGGETAEKGQVRGVSLAIERETLQRPPAGGNRRERTAQSPRRT